ncbi:MAG: YggS family pyridoxal phosphate-dependent enzyme [Gemmatimonadaceae bacterium]|nr:YggS family pyridoxal phosphate-dependent enzyme [Gemmatimonadaceae bacterium]MDQ3520093.1 YggS family pyridoxal phosphate-dependent enzyme [Gemmatimonadota bacterium]
MSLADLAGRVVEVRDRIAAAAERGGHAQNVKLIAVTKSWGPDAIRAAWDAGVTDVGENRVQEALGKMAEVDVPVSWHLIGHLQRNKVRSLDRFSLLHSLDNSRLAEAVHEFGLGHVVDALVQVNVVSEVSKGGYGIDSIAALADRLALMPGVRILGVMTMAPFGADERLLRRVFSAARLARDVLASAGHPATELSMGMSGDFEVAVEEGATMVRLGTVLFGEKQ